MCLCDHSCSSKHVTLYYPPSFPGSPLSLIVFLGESVSLETRVVYNIPAVLLLALEAFSYHVSVSQQQQSAASTPGDKEAMTSICDNITSSQNLHLYIMYHNFRSLETQIRPDQQLICNPSPLAVLHCKAWLESLPKSCAYTAAIFWRCVAGYLTFSVSWFLSSC